ncbi:hypothetical protein BDB01DRAFT_614966 [Pilobolus umbonatus]|nr:hypothetical protein BDB01DRAFT_614966 [Pilobolus umbonatus]
MQSYIGEHMQLINAEQKIILRRIKYVDNITYTASQTIISAFNLAKTTSDKVAEASVIREQTKQIKERTISILKSLSSIEEYLDPDDRNQLKTDDRWAVLNELRSKNQPQSSDYLSTDTSRPELTSRSCSSSKSPSTVEKVIVTGESSRKEMDHESLNEDYVTTADSRSDHSSVAISRLKGLSSRSIHTPNTISAPVPTRSISEQIQRRHSSDS